MRKVSGNRGNEYLYEWDADRKVLGDGYSEEVAVKARRMIIDVVDYNSNVKRGGARRLTAVVRQQMTAVPRHRLTSKHNEYTVQLTLIAAYTDDS